MRNVCTTLISFKVKKIIAKPSCRRAVSASVYVVNNSSGEVVGNLQEIKHEAIWGTVNTDYEMRNAYMILIFFKSKLCNKPQ